MKNFGIGGAPLLLTNTQNKMVAILTKINSGELPDEISSYPMGFSWVYVQASSYPNLSFPHQWGFLVSLRWGNECTQLWFSQSVGKIFQRSGNSKGWTESYEADSSVGYWRNISTLINLS